MLIQVKVEKLDLLLPVGWFEEERDVGTRLLVTLTLEYKSERIEDKLENTIDYSEMHQLLKDCVNEYKLIETYAETVLTNVADRFSHVQLTSGIIEIEKKQILEKGSRCEGQTVTLVKNFT